MQTWAELPDEPNSERKLALTNEEKKKVQWNCTNFANFRTRQVLFGSTPPLSHSWNLCIVFGLHGKRLRNRIGMLINEIGARKKLVQEFLAFRSFCLLCEISDNFDLWLLWADARTFISYRYQRKQLMWWNFCGAIIFLQFQRNNWSGLVSTIKTGNIWDQYFFLSSELKSFVFPTLFSKLHALLEGQSTEKNVPSFLGRNK